MKITNKILIILSFIPIVNIGEIVYFIIKGISLKKGKTLLISLFIFVGIMFLFAVLRAFATIILSFASLYHIVDIFTYFSIYVSFVISNLVFLKMKICDKI